MNEDWTGKDDQIFCFFGGEEGKGKEWSRRDKDNEPKSKNYSTQFFVYFF